MKLSTKALYGLRACYLLAENYPEKTVSASALEKEISVSGKYLEKIMRILSSRNIVSAVRGAGGGYYLTKDPSKITVGEVVRALEDDMEIVGCVVKPCGRCPTGAVWKKLYDGINQVLDSMTIRSIIEDYNSKKEVKNEKDISGQCGDDCTR